MSWATVNTHRALRRAGVDAELHVYESYIPGSIEHYAELSAFVLKHLKTD